MNPTIMHVDDNSDTREAVKALLKTGGYKVISMRNGKSCLKKLKKERPKLFLFDIMMPEMSGWDLFNKIKKRRINSKVIFLSVLPISRKQKNEMRKRGVSDYVMKPFEPEELLGKIKKLVPLPEVYKTKELSINIFINKLKHKDKKKILSEILIYLIVLQTINSKKNIHCQEIIKQVLSELKVLTSSDLIKKFLSYKGFTFQNRAKQKALHHQIKKELISRFNIFVGSNVLHSLLSKWKKQEIVESKMVKRNKLYKLTNRGKEGIKLLADYFLKILKEEN